MSARQFHGCVSAAGKIVLRDPGGWSTTLRDLVGHEIVVSVERLQDARSLAQGKYYWGVCVPFFQDQWSAGRKRMGVEPLTKRQTHETLVDVILPPVDGELQSTAELHADDFSLLIDGCREMALLDYGANLPSQ